ncbi:MAG: YigZ family protein [Anaerolineae bacterium]|nr:YigZ family protein [Anaerolineae bacterium]
MSKKYRIPTATIRMETEVSKSRFIATVGMAATATDARAFIAAIRTEMPDASHHVYAFRAGYGSSVTEGVSDDGEPTGTSGPPILNVLRGSEIGDIVMVVTRYFGGIKLGTGGLVRAYSDAARSALALLTTHEKVELCQLGLTVPYALYERIKQTVEQYSACIDDEAFEAEVTLFVTLPVEQVEAFTVTLRDLSAGKIEPVVLTS